MVKHPTIERWSTESGKWLTHAICLDEAHAEELFAKLYGGSVRYRRKQEQPIYPRAEEAVEFTKEVAALLQGPEDEAQTFDDAIGTLTSLINRAKAICGTVRIEITNGDSDCTSLPEGVSIEIIDLDK